MKLSPKTLLLLLPILLWALFIVFLKIQQQAPGNSLPTSNKTIWGKGDQQLSVEIIEETILDLEMLQYIIMVTDQQGDEVMRKSATIDMDMGGTGLVSLLQGDGDEEYEVVVATSRKVPGPNDYYLDYVSGKVEKKALSELSPEAFEQIRNWYSYNTPSPFDMGYFIILTVLYYILFFPVAWVIRKFLPRKSI